MWKRATLLLLVVHAVLAVLLFRDYGVTYDEETQVGFGEAGIRWYASGLRDWTTDKNADQNRYGLLFDLPAQLLTRAAPWPAHETRHLFNALFAVLAAWGVARLATRASGPRTGFLAALVLLLTPRFFGHGFNNPKDVPFAALYVWTIDAIAAVLMALPAPGRARLVWLGVTLGLALGARLAAILCLGWFGLALAVWWLRGWLQGRSPTGRRTDSARGSVGDLRRALEWCALVGAVAVAVMLPFWPAFQFDPIRNPWRALAHMSVAARGTFDVLFAGTMVSIDAIPRGYVATWLLLTLPELCLAGLVLWLGRVAVGASRRERPSLVWLLIVVAGLVPLVLPLVVKTRLYDEVRHLMFACVLLAVLAGRGFAVLLEGSRALRIAGGALVAGLATLAVWDMARLHPYQTVFFNRALAGGLAGAAPRFETDYWGNSLREAALWLAHDAENAPGTRLRVMSVGTPMQTAVWLPAGRFDHVGSIDETPGLEATKYTAPPDWYLATTRWRRDALYPGAVRYRVARDGVTLAVVVEVDKAAARLRAR